jgi:hypothetical protein
MPKFYRYIIYRFYTWRLKVNGLNPVLTVICSLIVIHVFQFLILILIIGEVFPNSKIEISKEDVLFFYFGCLGYYYFVIYSKAKWEKYIEEFQNESEDERSRGTLLFVSYTLLPFIVFFVLLAILTNNR